MNTIYSFENYLFIAKTLISCCCFNCLFVVETSVHARKELFIVAVSFLCNNGTDIRQDTTSQCGYIKIESPRFP